MDKEKQYCYSFDEGKLLLQFARSTITEYLTREHKFGDKTSAVETLNAPCFQYSRGNFVTLKIGDMLRGCIGNLQASEPIVEGVKANAINAAFRDSRFSPLQAKELSDVTIDISILTQPTPLEYKTSDDLLHKLRKGVDGVVLKRCGASATFLPQVWEQLPVPEYFLSHLCRKAGMSPDAWQTELLEVLIYQAQHFSE